MKYFATAADEDPKLQELESEQVADDEVDQEEEDEGRTVKITATITVDSGVNLNELKDILFNDLADVLSVDAFDWEEVK